MAFDFEPSIILETAPQLLGGMKLTLIITLGGLLVGLLLGVVTGLANTSRSRFLRGIAILYIEAIRGTPLIVQVMFLYFGLPLALGMRIPPDVAGVIAIGVNSGAGFAVVLAAVLFPPAPLSRVAAAVEVDDPLVEVPSATPSEIESRIGGYIAELIPDGATLQIGVGGIPNAVLAALTGHKHLGLHTEAMTDGVLPLLESGVIDNSLKKVMPGTTVASLALGSRRLYDYMDYRKDLLMKDVAWTNDPFRIRENPRVMAINSAVEVDLTGQVCADSVGERIISGVGGQHDFMYGGALSEGGKTFIAIPSTTPKGESKIKALLTPGAGVVTTRHMVQHVVTEYGVAHLRGRNLAERARALISVAHPSVREELEKAACERFGYTFLRIK